jgi:hypothetical protein
LEEGGIYVRESNWEDDQVRSIRGLDEIQRALVRKARRAAENRCISRYFSLKVADSLISSLNACPTREPRKPPSREALAVLALN